jgi:hypothetical protein
MILSNKMARALMALSLLSTITLANCGGGSSTTPQASPTTAPINPVNPVNPNSLGTLTVTVQIPTKAASPASFARTKAVRKPSYITAAVGSIVFTQTTSGGSVLGTPTVTVLTVGGAGCTSSAGTQTCTTILTAPLGQDQWTVDTYVSTNGSGNPISIGVLPFDMLSGTGNVANLTLNPIVSSLAFSTTSTSCNATAICSTALTLQAKDPTGAVIIGADPFIDANGNLLTVNITSSTDLFAKNTEGTAANLTFTNASANTLTDIQYQGTGIAGIPAVATATAGSLSASFTYTLAAGTITSSLGSTLAIGSDVGITSASLTASEANFPGTFTATSSDCGSVVTIGDVSNSGSPASFTITQIGAGHCSILLSDAQGGTTSVGVTSTTFTVLIH